MTLLEYADIIGKQIVIRCRTGDYAPSLRWYAMFDGVYIASRGGLASSCGEGHTPQEAMGNYAKKIAGERIIISDKNGECHQEFRVPLLIEEEK